MADEPRTPQYGEDQADLPPRPRIQERLFLAPETPPESLLPIHPACGHRLGSLGCRQHHRGTGEPVPDITNPDTFGQAAIDANVAAGYVELIDGTNRWRVTPAGRRRAEKLLGLPAGSLDVADQDG